MPVAASTLVTLVHMNSTVFLLAERWQVRVLLYARRNAVLYSALLANTTQSGNRLLSCCATRPAAASESDGDQRLHGAPECVPLASATQSGNRLLSRCAPRPAAASQPRGWCSAAAAAPSASVACALGSTPAALPGATEPVDHQ